MKFNMIRIEFSHKIDKYYPYHNTIFTNKYVNKYGI